MAILQVSLELFPTIEDFGALIDTADGVRLMTAPGLDLIMTGILVPLPVILAAEHLGTGWEGTSVWASVPLLVFSGQC